MQVLQICKHRATMQNVCRQATVRVKSLDGTPIRLGRGVRQGDPLSPLLFNLVVDRALGVLSEDVGFRLGEHTVNALAYADDIVLLSSTSIGLQENLNRLYEAFQRSGLDINANKTGVLSLAASGREKVRVLTGPTFRLGDVMLPQRSPTDVWRYLGATYEGARDYAEPVSLDLELSRLSRAPLKHQQRLLQEKI